MPTPPLSREVIEPVIRAYHEAIEAGCEELTSNSPALYVARKLSMDPDKVRRRLRTAKESGWLNVEQGRVGVESFSTDVINGPTHHSHDEPFDEYLSRRLSRSNHLRQFGQNQFVDFAFRDDLPIGIILFGDPHLDDEHCDLQSVKDHMDATHEDSVYGINLGDTLNNWVGRLERLHCHQSTTAERGWELAEWFVHNTRWLAQISGNHDDWSSHRDPLQWISRGASGAYIKHGARLRLNFPNGAERRLNVRHQFRGRSTYNDTHGPLRELLTGCRDHVAAQGHLHVSAHLRQVDPDSRRVMHAVQVGSFKRFDSYASELGLHDKNLSPSALVVIDPKDDGPEGITVWMDTLGAGLRYLKSIRP